MRWWRRIVSKARSRIDSSAGVRFRPRPDESNDDVGRELLVEDLRDEVEVRDEGLREGTLLHRSSCNRDKQHFVIAHRLQDDRHIGRVEQLDRVRLTSAAGCSAGGPKSDVHLEALEVDDETKDEDRGHLVGDVGQVLTV